MSMSGVKRYAMSRKGMVSMPIGDYVRHKDYAVLKARVAELEKKDCEAATHVESVIAMRTGFTGDPPYVGWKGLGLALNEALDANRDAEEAEAYAASLESDMNALAEMLRKSKERNDALEAKLATAVEALDRLVALNDDYSPFGGELLQDRVERTWQKARTTLAELTGGKDE